MAKTENRTLIMIQMSGDDNSSFYFVLHPKEHAVEEAVCSAARRLRGRTQNGDADWSDSDSRAFMVVHAAMNSARGNYTLEEAYGTWPQDIGSNMKNLAIITKYFSSLGKRLTPWFDGPPEGAFDEVLMVQSLA